MPHRLARKYARFGLYLLGEFRWPIVVLLALVLGFGALFSAVLPELPFAKACWGVFMLILVQPELEFPDAWPLQILFFVIPVVGLGALADSVVRLGFLIFSSKRKLQEWWIMEAAALRDHVVLCGLGQVGFRIVQELQAIREPVVVIDKNRDSHLADEVQDLGIPVIFGEARLRKTLEKANVAGAKAIILSTEDDLANLDAGLTAREINPKIRVVMRLFDDTLASKVATTFKLGAISTSHVAAPAFVAAATGRSVLHSFQVDGQAMHVADLQVRGVAGRTIPDLQKEFAVSVVQHKCQGMADPNPTHVRPLQPGDSVVLVAPLEKIRHVEAANR